MSSDDAPLELLVVVASFVLDDLGEHADRAPAPTTPAAATPPSLNNSRREIPGLLSDFDMIPSL
jgi:hypothetical protein